MKCKYCGLELSNLEDKCPNCGNSILKENEKRNIFKVIIIMVLSIIAILVTILGIKFLNNKNEFSLVENASYREIDLSKSLNTSGLKYKNPTDKIGDYGLSASINPDKKSITLTIDWEKFGPLSNMKYKLKGEKVYQIKDFSTDVYSVFIGEIGKNLSGLTLVYLLENGNVEYTQLFVIKKDKQGNSYVDFPYKYLFTEKGVLKEQYLAPTGRLEKISRVVKLYNADVEKETIERTILGMTDDGSFYDIGSLIIK